MMPGMAIPVVEFSWEGYKIIKDFAEKSTYLKDIFELLKLIISIFHVKKLNN